MKLTTKINSEDLTLDVYLGDECIKRLDPIEAKEFFENVRKEEKEKGYIFESKWTTVSIADIEAALSEEGNETIDDVIGIDFEITCYYRCFPEAHIYFTVYTKKGKCNVFWGKDLSDNFKNEDIYAGNISNHGLRACLSESLLNYILDQPKFKITICGEKESIYKFFDEENTRFYEPYI